MSTIPEVAEKIGTVLIRVATEVERTSGFVRRHSKLTGALFVQTLVLGWLAKPSASLGELSQMAARLGVGISPQGLDQRLTTQATMLLEEVLTMAVRQVVTAEPTALPVLERFTAVTAQDSTTIVLPEEWADLWPGCGGSTAHGDAALKLQVRLDRRSGHLEGPLLEAGRAADQTTALQTTPVPAGSLRLQDLGYFSLDVFAAVDRQGGYWLSRSQAATALFLADGQRIADLPRWLAEHRHSRTLDVAVQVGARHRLPARLLAVRVPHAVAVERRRRLRQEARDAGRSVSQARLRLARWTLLLTNVPAALLTAREALVLLRARWQWQIELLFKLWKQHGQVDAWRSARPDRILCEVYAKLIGLILQHWILLVTGWDAPNRSLVKIAQAVRASAVLLAAALTGVLAWAWVLDQIRACAAVAGCLNPRRRHPNTFPLFLALPEDP